VQHASSARRGVYGAAVHGLPGAEHLMRPAVDGWPVLRVVTARGARTLRADVVGEHEAAFSLEHGRLEVRLDRATTTASFTTEQDHPDEAYLHPFIARAATVLARWHHREAFHAGAFVLDGVAWAVLGAREAGKSTALAHAHLRGLPVLTDDVLVVDDGVVLPGPGSLDLREGTARHLRLGEPLGVVGSRERWRVALPGDLAPARLGGWVLPIWGEPTAVLPIPPQPRQALVASALFPRLPPEDPLRLLALGTLPAVAWRRPRDLTAADVALEVLLEALGGLGRAAQAPDAAQAAWRSG
jgi:hypothetical protein